MMETEKNQPKVIAYYLPQYHEIPENNEWWGEGFTEWTNVKKAKPVFEGQIQPRIPLNNNYYDLMDRKTVEWQSELAKKYGLYGFCYFHYYFKNGKRILERPAENLLKWKDIEQRYCFFWANVEWRRTWSTVEGKHSTSWSEEEGNHSGNGLLLEQDYGGEKEWRDHFNYLLQFFKDERYIKIDGKPIFAIYYVSYIPDAIRMFKLWDQLARENGFPGLEIMAVNEEIEGNPYIKGILHYGGGQVSRKIGNKIWEKEQAVKRKIRKITNNSEALPMVMDYDRYWRYILKDKPYGIVQNYPGGTVRYDETPRRGENSFCLINDSPEKFEKYMIKQLRRGKSVFHTEYLFLDAWNEWGEGNYLEPDTNEKYGYLQALSNALQKA